MTINQKSLAVLSSPYLFAISQVGAALATFARRRYGTVRTSLSTLAKQNKDTEHNPPSSDGYRSTIREDKYFRARSYGDDYCGDTIPVNSVSRKGRRAAAKFARRNPTIKVS